MRHRNHRVCFPVAAGALGVGWVLISGHSYAQVAAGVESGSTLEEVVVTAERREVDIQKAAASVSVRSGAELIQQGKYSLASILEDVPGILGGAAAATLTAGGSGGTDTLAAGLTIRGISSSRGAPGSTVSNAAAAAIYVDGVYEGVGGGYDIDRVEVLRGPQGTLYGRSATSGVVAIHTRNPDLGESHVNGLVEAGNYDLRHYSGGVSVPIVADTLALRVSANRYQRDGYINGDDGERSSTDARVKLLWQANEDLSLLLGFALQNNDETTGGRQIFASSDPNVISYGVIQALPTQNDFRQYWAELNWNLGFATLSYQPALRTWEQDAQVSMVANGNELLSTRIVPKDDFMTHELRLASAADSKLAWQVGTLYYDNDLESFASAFLPALNILTFAALTSKNTTASGVFGEATYPFTDTWRITAGARYDYTKVHTEQDYTGLTGVTRSIPADQQTHKFNNVTYKLRAEHDLAPENLLYASVSTGFSPGDVSQTTGADGTPTVIELEAETLTAFEIGTKNRFLDHRLQVNGALFYYDYGGYQNSLAVTLSSVQSYSTPLRAYGAELDLLFQATHADRIGFDISYTHAEFFDKQADFAQQYALDDAIGSVPLKANLFYEHVFTLPGGSQLSLRGDAAYLSDRYAPTSTFTQSLLAAGGEPYVHLDREIVGNLNASWLSPDKRLAITGYVRNIADNRYYTAMSVLAANAATGAVLPRSQWRFQPEVSDPRTYGVAVSVNY